MKITFQKGKANLLVEEAPDWNKCLQKIGQDRDREAFARLFKHFSPLLKSFLMKSGSSSIESAEEVVQETMTKVWRKAENYSVSQGAASTWIYTIARNTRIDSYRRQARQNPDQLNADDIYGDSIDGQENEAPHSSLVRFRDVKHVKEKLSLLPVEQAEVLTLMYYEGKSGQQIADVLGLPLGTVKSRIRLALARLKLGLHATEIESARVEGART